MQVYFFRRPTDKATLKKRVMACIGDIDHSLACNRLKLNPAKSATARRLYLVDNSMFHFADGDATPATTMRNLGTFFMPPATWFHMLIDSFVPDFTNCVVYELFVAPSL